LHVFVKEDSARVVVIVFAILAVRSITMRTTPAIALPLPDPWRSKECQACFDKFAHHGKNFMVCLVLAKNKIIANNVKIIEAVIWL